MNKFAELGLSQPLVDAVVDLGFEEPTDIQAQAIPRLLQNDTDLVGLAQTGTGKTAAFGLPLLHLLDPSLKQTQGLILAPTRELCLQITREMELFGKNLPKLTIKAVYGGVDIVKQIREVKRGANVIVATPGRLRDMMRRKAVDISHIAFVVLDEADEMLNMGFKEELDAILQDTPDEKFTWLFSATMPSEVRRIAKSYMNSPLEISVGQQNSSNENIDHQYVIVRPRERYEVLRRFLDYDTDVFGVVFTRTRRDAQEIADQLTKDGYNADALHGDLNQTQRDRVMGRFRTRRLKILVATDVAARGIDVNDITHVFHYNIPEDIHFYTHRSGRTGRAGKQGISLVLAHPNDRGLLHRIERIIKTKFNPAKVPNGKDICIRQLEQRFQKLLGSAKNEDIEAFMPKLLEQVEDISKEELVRRIASSYFSRSLQSYLHSSIDSKGKGNISQENSRRLFINVGAVDLDGKGEFLSLICTQANISGSAIGKIKLERTYSFFDVEEGSFRQVVKSFAGFTLAGREIRVNEDRAGGDRGGRRDYKGGKKKKWKKKPRRYEN